MCCFLKIFTFVPDNSSGAYDRDDLVDKGTNPGRRYYGLESPSIRTEGYVIGWQYYLRAVPVQCKSSSYVNIFGKRDDSPTPTKYTHIATTLLKPEDPNKSGINYQFVQNVLIKVQAGDVIGWYTVGCTPGTAKHLISAKRISGSSGVHNGGLLTQTTPTHTFTDSNFKSNNWDVALKVYTASKNNTVPTVV